VLADAAVSVLVIIGLLFGRFLGWSWMDPVVGLCGAFVILTWSYSLVRDTGSILLDMTPDRGMAQRMRAMLEADGDRLTDLHLWRLGPGHLHRHADAERAAILSSSARPLSRSVACDGPDRASMKRDCIFRLGTACPPGTMRATP